MFKMYLSLTLISALFLTLVNAPAVFAGSKGETARIEKIKFGIAELGTGEDARVTVRLRDKTKLSGYISAADAESFVIVDSETGTETTVAYPQVGQVKGHNLSTKTKIAIGIGILAAVVLVIVIIAASSEVEFPNR